VSFWTRKPSRFSFTFNHGLSIGAGLLLLLFGVFCTVRAVQTWRRTGLPLATTAMGVGAGAMIAAGSALAFGWDPRTDPISTLVLLIAFTLIPAALMVAEILRSRETWRRWREEVGACTCSRLCIYAGELSPCVRVVVA